MGAHFHQTLILLAQAAQGAAPPAGDQAQGPGLLQMAPLFLGIAFIFYFLVMRPQRKEQQRRQALLSGVKKNDRVVTIGGIYGVVTNVQREDDVIVIRVDETNSTKLRMTLASIARVLEDESSTEASSK